MKQITSKKGTPIHSAAFSCVYRIRVRAKSNRSRRERDAEFTTADPMFHAILEVAKESVEITIKSVGISHGMLITNDHYEFQDRASESVVGLIKKHESCGIIVIYTNTVDEIRALAKEIRTDKAVAKAAKVPAQPKKSLKDRGDVI